MTRIAYLFATAWLLCFLSTAQAGVGKIIALSEAVEAENIQLFLDDNKISGKVFVNGCENCPLELKLTVRSRLFYKEKNLPRKQAWEASGKPGTVFFDKKSKIVQKIKW